MTNIYTTNVTEIHNTYINKTVNVYNTTNVTNTTYVNRTVATVVVPQSALASGRPIAQVQRVQLTPQVRAQLSAAPIIPHPMITPATAIVAVKAPPRAVPPVQARPVVETRQGFERAGAPGTPVRAPQPTVAVNRPGQPAPVTGQPINRAAFPQQRQVQTIAPAPMAHPAPTAQVPANRPAPEVAPVRPPVTSQPAIQRPAQVAQPVASPVQRAAPRPPDQPRPLINKTPPAPVQPSFADQKRAIQSVDPGRPLGPQQVENLRNGRPAGPAQQAEAPHPPPAPRSNTVPPAKPKPGQPNDKEPPPPPRS